MKKLKQLFIIQLFLGLWCVNANAQSLNLSDSLTQLLKQTGDSILRGSNDSVRLQSNLKFYGLMDSVLKNELAFITSFDSIKNLAVLQSPDKKVRIYNWILPLERGGEYRYFGFVQIRDKKTKQVLTYPLTEKKWTTDSAEMLKLNADNWYGALYYKIVEKKANNKTYYTLLGWHGKDFQSTRKVIDVLTLSNEKLQFGAPLFKTGGKTKSRIVFEYNAQATMSLKYEEQDKRIVFDHLSPSDPRPEAKNMFSLYGPDMSYDGLKFEKGFWMIKKNIQPRNEQERKQKDVKLEKRLRITNKQ